MLDKTGFYPNSGGVEYDTCKIIRKIDGKEFKVIYVGKFEGEVSHEVDTEGLNGSEEVHCILDC